MFIQENTSRISSGSSFTGDLNTCGKLIIAGAFNGNISVEGQLMLTESGACLGDLMADNVVVCGKVEGNISARSRIELRADAKVTGNICAPALEVQPGAKITGKLQVGKPKQLPAAQNLGSNIHQLPIKASA